MVKTILDNFCVKSGILCTRCQDKLKKGQVTDLDVRTIRMLSELEGVYPIIGDIHFHRAVEADNTLAVIVNRRDIPRILSYGGKIVRALGEKTDRKVKILGQGGDPRQFLEELFSPLSILTINTVWLPDGSTETKVILPGRRPNRMPIDLEITRKLAKDIQGMTLRIEFER